MSAVTLNPGLSVLFLKKYSKNERCIDQARCLTNLTFYILDLLPWSEIRNGTSCQKTCLRNLNGETLCGSALETISDCLTCAT